MDLCLNPYCLLLAVFLFHRDAAEAKELQLRHRASFEEYARAVPLFIPRLTAAKFIG